MPPRSAPDEGRMIRPQRKALDRRRDRAIEKARAKVLNANADRDLAIVDAWGGVEIINGRDVASVLAAMGLADWHHVIENARTAYEPGWMPAVVLVEEWATVRWIPTLRLVHGGAA
jgi:hypothetical protein